MAEKLKIDDFTFEFLPSVEIENDQAPADMETIARTITGDIKRAESRSCAPLPRYVYILTGVDLGVVQSNQILMAGAHLWREMADADQREVLLLHEQWHNFHPGISGYEAELAADKFSVDHATNPHAALAAHENFDRLFMEKHGQPLHVISAATHPPHEERMEALKLHIQERSARETRALCGSELDVLQSKEEGSLMSQTSLPFFCPAPKPQR